MTSASGVGAPRADRKPDQPPSAAFSLLRSLYHRPSSCAGHSFPVWGDGALAHAHRRTLSQRHRVDSPWHPRCSSWSIHHARARGEGGDEMPESQHPKGAAHGPIDDPGMRGGVMERTHDRLSPERLRRHLTTRTVGHHVFVFNSVDSTNSALARLADRGATEGTVVLAEAQTAGRGRHGSEWFSPDGREPLCFRPLSPPHRAARAAAVRVHRLAGAGRGRLAGGRAGPHQVAERRRCARAQAGRCPGRGAGDQWPGRLRDPRYRRAISMSPPPSSRPRWATTPRGQCPSTRSWAATWIATPLPPRS